MLKHEEEQFEELTNELFPKQDKISNRMFEKSDNVGRKEEDEDELRKSERFSDRR